MKPYLITNTPQHFTWTSWWASSWHTGNPGRAWSVHNLQWNLTWLQITLYLNQLVSVIMTYREPRQSMKCTQFREQWNLTWLQIHRNILPEPVGERPYLITNTPQHFTWTSWWASSWHTGNPGRAWSVHNLENSETLLDYKYTATFYLNQLVSVIMTYREPRQSMKCTQFRDETLLVIMT